MEEWITWLLFGRDTVICDRCLKMFVYQRMHLYINVDNEVEEVLCEECWTKEDTPTIKRYLDIGSPYKGLTAVAKILEIKENEEHLQE